LATASSILAARLGVALSTESKRAATLLDRGSFVAPLAFGALGFIPSFPKSELFGKDHRHARDCHCDGHGVPARDSVPDSLDAFGNGRSFPHVERLIQPLEHQGDTHVSRGFP
jgi:hypothetical protein